MENKKKIYIGNLPYSVTSDSLKEMFGAFGDVVDAIIIVDKYNNRSKGFGFVEFADEAAAEKAIAEMNEKEIEGRKIIVNIARPAREG